VSSWTPRPKPPLPPLKPGDTVENNNGARYVVISTFEPDTGGYDICLLDSEGYADIEYSKNFTLVVEFVIGRRYQQKTDTSMIYEAVAKREGFVLFWATPTRKTSDSPYLQGYAFVENSRDKFQELP
jgi:hypothetical protein